MTSAARVEEVRAPKGLPRLLSGVRPDRAATLAEHLTRFGHAPAPYNLIATIEEAGLHGRGGAGFPTGRKLRTVASQPGKRAVVVNAAEGEPASAKDKALVRLAPHLVLDGAMLAAQAIGAHTAVIAIARTAKNERRALSHAIAERRHVGGLELRLATVPDAFVSGEESALLQAVQGRPAKPTVKPPYPFERGLGGLPTLVQNVETLAHVALIARFGAAWFRSAGSDDAPGTALVTVSGAVTRPGVHEVELGSSLGDLVLRTGGATEAIGAFLVGGYFGRWIPSAQASAFRLTPDVLGAGAIVAFPSSACAAAECARVTRYLSAESAGQCGPCVFGLAAIADAFERLAGGDARGRARARAQLLRWAGQVRGRGACRHPDGAARFVESALTTFAEEIAQHERLGRCDEATRNVLPVPAVRS